MLTWKKRPPRTDPSSRPREHHVQSSWDLIFVARLIHELNGIYDDQKAAEKKMAATLDAIPEDRRASARNLLHYLALRGRDHRSLQESLASMGLSSLGRAEGHIQHNVLLLLKHLNHIVRRSWAPPAGAELVVTRHDSARLLDRRASRLLGEKPTGRSTRIMVTMPSEAALDFPLLRDLVDGGMNSMRINCAHDGPDVWEKMIENLRRAEKETGRRCTVAMDLGGPKIRTGALEPGPKVLKWKPRRDAFGRPQVPARLWVTSREDPQSPPEPASARLTVRKAWLDTLQAGDRIRFSDARHAKRSLEVSTVAKGGCWALATDTAYVEPGTPLVRVDSQNRPGVPEPLGDLPSLDQPILLKQGDRLLLTRAPDPGRRATLDDRGKVSAAARIPCTLPRALDDVRGGEPVLFDDGKITAHVVETSPEGLLIEVDRANGGSAKLGADKGINFPASALTVPSLTEKDLEDLKFIATHADLVGYSFVRSPEDLRDLRRHLARLKAEHLGIVLKIETRSAFANLPALLLAALEAPMAGIMIARGDLAIECGYERLAELQEEILWLCEAAHLPVIWATQVLEHLAKDGQPSRAEVTDAAMGERAECVMLNKGPHIVEAVRSLDDIIRRMEAHQNKKTPLLRPLKVASLLDPEPRKNG
jgi:pyruvate kinase